MEILSPAFEHNEDIPDLYTCDGEDINPPLEFEGIPPRTKSLALVCDDPDAPGEPWVHWITWNMAPDTMEIEEGSKPDGVVGTNSWGKIGYGGPCPPSGTHRYVFTLYALNAMLELEGGATKEDLEESMEGHILDQAKLIGLYSRM